MTSTTTALSFPPLARFRFRFEAIEPIKMPAYPGSAWRGLIGQGLRRTACVTRQPTCTGCLLVHSCVYSTLFETPAPAGQAAQGYTAMPHPFVLDIDPKAHPVEPGADFDLVILLAVTGLSPQVVTETLFALATRERDPWIPTEIHLITTDEGAERARLSLLHPRSGWFHRLRRDYDLPSIDFDAERIHLLRDADGAPLTDIRTPADTTSEKPDILDHGHEFVSPISKVSAETDTDTSGIER